jgi:hypothetical protein
MGWDTSDVAVFEPRGKNSGVVLIVLARENRLYICRTEKLGGVSAEVNARVEGNRELSTVACGIGASIGRDVWLAHQERKCSAGWAGKIGSRGPYFARKVMWQRTVRCCCPWLPRVL